MKNYFTSTLFVLLVAVLPHATAFAQLGADNNNQFVVALGKEPASSEITTILSSYKLDAVNDAHYVSKTGVELLLHNGKVNEVNLYGKSAVYGSFSGALPNGLKFGMSSGTVKGMLGKPTVSYNNGYSEFSFPAYIVTCWFDGGVLSQVGLTGR
jgi:hypothetical protein